MSPAIWLSSFVRVRIYEKLASAQLEEHNASFGQASQNKQSIELNELRAL